MMLLEIILIFGGFGLMGKFGKSLFSINFMLFGIFCYVYPPLLIYLNYLYLKNKKLDLNYIKQTLSYILLFLILLILQSSSLDLGILGKAILVFLEPHIGGFGIWVLCIFWIFVCLLALKNQDLIELSQNIDFSKLLLFAKKRIQSLKDSHFLQKIAKSFKQFFSIKPRPIIAQAPSIEFHSQPKLPFEEEVNKDKIMEKEYPIFKSEKIKIQEVLIAPERNDQKAKIRIIDQYIPPKENPFLQSHFPKEAQNISTSAELLRKIKNQEFDKQATQIKKQSQQTRLEEQDKQKTERRESEKLQTKTISQDLPNHPPQEYNLDSQDLESPNSDWNKTESFQTHPSKTPKSAFDQNSKEDKTKDEIPQSIPSFLQKSKTAYIKSLEENEALLKEIDQGKIIPPKNYTLPPIDLLTPAPKYQNEIDENEMDKKIQSLLTKLKVFKIDGDVIRTYSGPIITTFEFRPAPNVKVSRIQSLESDIAMALEAKSIRIQAPIPGKNVVGIEIPNPNTQTIYLREIFESEIFQNSTSPLTLALGKDVVGNPFVTDLKKLPHLLIAGTTGSGKSVGVNAMILSLLYHNSPDNLKLMMVDPKMVEFMPYSDLPHLITPIIVDPQKAIIGLANAVKEMERRYKLMGESQVKDIESYNQKAQESNSEKLPYFVIIIDELADLMMTAGKEVEHSMARIAQMGRASGMHLIVATQSPRAEVLTGLIKTNFPAHLSYKVGSKIDASIIGCAGAESLLGRGDMLFTPPGVSGLIRLHAPWSSEEEIARIIAYIKDQREVKYNASFLPKEKEILGAIDQKELNSEILTLLPEAQKTILNNGKASISLLQRKLGIGYNKAAALVEKLEEIGFLSKPDTRGNRKILDFLLKEE